MNYCSPVLHVVPIRGCHARSFWFVFFRLCAEFLCSLCSGDFFDDALGVRLETDRELEAQALQLIIKWADTMLLLKQPVITCHFICVLGRQNVSII